MQALAALGRHSEALRQYQRGERGAAGGAGGRAGSRDRAAAGADPQRADARARRRRRPPTPRGRGAPGARDPEAPRVGGRAGRPGRARAGGPADRGAAAGAAGPSGRGHVVLRAGRGRDGQDHVPAPGAGRARARRASPPTWCEAGEYGAGRNVEVVRGVLARSTRGARAAGAPAGGGRAAGQRARRRPRPRWRRRWIPRPGPRPTPGRVEALVAAAGARQPRVIAVEDLHWCDAETTRILCAIAAPRRRSTGRWSPCSPAARARSRPSCAWTALLRQGLAHLDRPRAAGARGRRPAGRPLRPARPPSRSAAASSAPPDTRCSWCSCWRAGRRTMRGAGVGAGGGAGPAGPGRAGRSAGAGGRRGAGGTVQPGADGPAARAQHPDPGIPVPALIDRLVQRGWLRPGRRAADHRPRPAGGRHPIGPGRAAALARLHRWAAEWFAALDPLTSAEHLEQAGRSRGGAGLPVGRPRGAGRAPAGSGRGGAGPHRRLPGGARTWPSRRCACAGTCAASAATPPDRTTVFARAGGAGAHATGSRRGPRLGMAAALRLLDRHRRGAGLPGRRRRRVTRRRRPRHARRAGAPAGQPAVHAAAICRAAGAPTSAPWPTRAQADSPADEVAALSGLGDAYYLAGPADQRPAGRSRPAASWPAATASCAWRRPAAMMLGLILLYANEHRRGAGVRPNARWSWRTSIADPRLQCLAGAVTVALHAERATGRRPARMASARRRSARRLGSERLEAMGLELSAHTSDRRGPAAGGAAPGAAGARAVPAQRRSAGQRPQHPVRPGACRARPGRRAREAIRRGRSSCWPRGVPVPQPLRSARGGRWRWRCGGASGTRPGATPPRWRRT